MPTWLLIIVLCLAVFRATRLITRDQLPLIAEPRDAFANRWGVYADAADKRVSIGGYRTNVFMRSVAYLWECDWCTSMWIAGLLTALTAWFTPLGSEHWWVLILIGLSASAVTGLIATVEPD